MSPALRKIWLAALAAASLLIAAAALRQKIDTPATAPAETPYEEADHRAQIEKISAPRSSQRPESRPRPQPAPSRPATAGLTDLSAEVAERLPMVSGYVIDQFTNWTRIPEGYAADGITLRGGALTLEGDSVSTAPRTGTLQSPALPLRQPALAAPVQPAAMPLPDGASVQVQISVSPDGQEWSPWLQVRRFHPPDGRRVSPPVQPSLAKADLHGPDLQSTQTLRGPAIRYRLALSASGTVSPEVTDVRVWKQESF